jgi:hypothetical protein
MAHFKREKDTVPEVDLYAKLYVLEQSDLLQETFLPRERLNFPQFK